MGLCGCYVDFAAKRKTHHALLQRRVVFDWLLYLGLYDMGDPEGTLCTLIGIAFGVIVARKPIIAEKCELTNSEISRYSRQLILPQFGVAGQLKLRSARVLIVGCGGLGCPAAIYLVAAGVGTLGLLDDDNVELNNLHRQIAHSESMVGKSKVSSLADRCTQLNSSVKIEHHCTHLTSSNAVNLIKRYDLVLDCSDNLATRYLVNDACAVCGPKPLVSGSALRLEGQMTVYLANRIRTKEELASGIRLPPEARSPCFRCLYPIPPAADTVQGCSEAGVFGVVPGIIGTMQAAEAIKLITGIGTVHNGRLFILDMERNLTRTVTLRNPRPDCAACGEHANMNEESIPSMNYAEFCGAPDHDKAPSLNLQRFRNRITVHELDQWRKSNTPHLMIDLRPEVEVELCRLKPCLFFPLKILLRDSVISQIYEKLKENLEKFSKRPFPIVLLCHRGNKSRIGAFQLASALCSFRHRHSQTDLPLAGENVAGTEESDTSDFVVCDVAGGLAAWANEIDPEFPSY